MTGMGFVVPFLPIYARELGASGFDLGILVAGFSLSMGLCQPFAGSLSEGHHTNQTIGRDRAIKDRKDPTVLDINHQGRRSPASSHSQVP